MTSLFQQHPQLPPVGAPDMNVQYPEGQPLPQPFSQMPIGQLQGDLPPMEQSPSSEQEFSYTGNPTVDKYIHAFIGGLR